MLYTGYVYHEIDNGNSAPVKSNPYHIPSALREEVKKKIEEMVRKAAMEWTTLVILIGREKMDGTPRYRYCAVSRCTKWTQSKPLIIIIIIIIIINNNNNNYWK
jgi:hypothetical protein